MLKHASAAKRLSFGMLNQHIGILPACQCKHEAAATAAFHHIANIYDHRQRERVFQ